MEPCRRELPQPAVLFRIGLHYKYVVRALTSEDQSSQIELGSTSSRIKLHIARCHIALYGRGGSLVSNDMPAYITLIRHTISHYHRSG